MNTERTIAANVTIVLFALGVMTVVASGEEGGSAAANEVPAAADRRAGRHRPGRQGLRRLKPEARHPQGQGPQHDLPAQGQGVLPGSQRRTTFPWVLSASSWTPTPTVPDRNLGTSWTSSATTASP